MTFSRRRVSHRNITVALTRLDYQQEAGLMSSVPIGKNHIPIQRGLTTSSHRYFYSLYHAGAFSRRGEALYYGLNALIKQYDTCDRKQLKNPNGLILGTPGSGKSFAAKREIDKRFPCYGGRYYYLRPGSRVFFPCAASERASDTAFPTGKA